MMPHPPAVHGLHKITHYNIIIAISSLTKVWAFKIFTDVFLLCVHDVISEAKDFTI